MPRMEQRHRYQPAVLWPKTGDDDHGEPIIGAAVRLRVRWVTGRSESVDAQGDPIALDAKAVVDRVIPLGSVMWPGDLDDWDDAGDDELWRVVTYSETPDLRNRAARREVGLSKFRGDLPGA